MTFEDDRGAYDQKDAAGFIRLNALRLRTLAAEAFNVAVPANGGFSERILRLSPEWQIS